MVPKKKHFHLDVREISGKMGVMYGWMPENIMANHDYRWRGGMNKFKRSGEEEDQRITRLSFQAQNIFMRSKRQVHS